jgi:hypothetical protein
MEHDNLAAYPGIWIPIFVVLVAILAYPHVRNYFLNKKGSNK